MKNILTLLVLFAAFVSCEKPITSDGDADTNKEVSPDDNLVVRVPADGLSSSRLNFAVYDMDGTRVKQVNQQMPLSHAASFQLTPGPYFLVVVAHSSDGNPTMTNPRKIQFTNAQGFTDTFLYSDSITVGDERKELNVTPKRIVSLCRFVLTDDYPADVAKMRFYYTGGSGAFDATTSLGCVNSKQDVKFDVSANNKQFDLYTFPYKSTEGTIHLVVSALDASGNEILQREFDVSIEKNYITWVSGSFFGGSGSDPTGGAGITSVTVNTDWAGETHVTF